MKNADLNLTGYPELLKQIKARIRKAQIKAALSANAEMILMYRDIGKMVHMRQQREGWGSGVIPKLSRDIRNELPGVRGFSERNIGYMIRFSREYDFEEILQQPVAELIFHEENRDTSPHAETKTICGQNLQSKKT